MVGAGVAILRGHPKNVVVALMGAGMENLCVKPPGRREIIYSNNGQQPLDRSCGAA